MSDIGAIGEIKPFIIIINKPINNTGVKNLPIISKTEDSFNESTIVIAKNTILVIAVTATFPASKPNIGITPISYVVAAVLGIAIPGPIQSTVAQDNITAGILPIWLIIPAKSVFALSIANIATNAKPISAM